MSLRRALLWPLWALATCALLSCAALGAAFTAAADSLVPIQKRLRGAGR